MKIYEFRISLKTTEVLGLDKDSMSWFFGGLSTNFEVYLQCPIQQLPRWRKENEGSHQGNQKPRFKGRRVFIEERAKTRRAVRLLRSPVNHGAECTMHYAYLLKPDTLCRNDLFQHTGHWTRWIQILIWQKGYAIPRDPTHFRWWMLCHHRNWAILPRG